MSSAATAASIEEWTDAPIEEWRDRLASPGEREHSVQLYSDLGFLARAVGHYVGSGLAKGEAVILVATTRHRQAFAERLVADGFDVDRLCDRGQLMFLDAAQTLSRLMKRGAPDARLFEPYVGGVIDQALAGGRYPRVRAYGEMVNLLWQNRELDAALRLEELWNDLAADRAFTLHCAYAMDAFDPRMHGGALDGVCHAHSYLIPVEDSSRLEAAVSRALINVLGPAAATEARAALAARPSSGSRMPAAQAAILGLSELLPSSAEAVLGRARRYYEASRPRSCPRAASRGTRTRVEAPSRA